MLLLVKRKLEVGNLKKLGENMATHHCRTKKSAKAKAKRLRKYGNTITIKKIGKYWQVYSYKA